MSPYNVVTIVALALPENVSVIRYAVAAVAAQLDFTLPEIEEIKVAISEAVTNVVVHAYPPDTATGEVTVKTEISENGLRVTVSDHGVGIQDLEQALQNGYSSDPERLGMGFYFMEELMDEVEVQSRPGAGTSVLLKRRPAATRNRSDRSGHTVS